MIIISTATMAMGFEFPSPLRAVWATPINFRFSFRAPRFNLRVVNGLETVQHAVPLRAGIRAA